ncbi:MAG: hypothetical protein HY063_03160 [Bacteroidetes bacterium]|nr:hypothetical protein [Bacteroidota bacterium]
MPALIKILHLEDNPSDADLVKRTLQRANLPCEIKVVDSKIDFQNALKYFSPSVILSDHTLPQFNSAEALRITNVRKAAGNALKLLDYDKVALFGTSVFHTILARIIILASGMSHKVKLLNTKEASVKWLNA